MPFSTPSDQPLRAYLVLKQPKPQAVSPVQGTAAQRTAFPRLTPDAGGRLRTRLEKLGLLVRNADGVSVAVEATRSTLERLFSGRIEERHLRPAGSAGPSFYSSDHYWAWADVPTIPNELRNDVETVVLPQPVEFC
jgi:hypothetical protein